MAPSKTKTNTRLPEIAREIKAIERKDIGNVIEKGRLLQEAANQCGRGEYMKWLKSEFGWSHNTALRLRSVYDLNRQIGDLDKLNISISAVYLVADLLRDHGGKYEGADQDRARDQAVGMAIIEAAKIGRVSYRMALVIIEHHKEPAKPEPAAPVAAVSEPEDESESDGDDESDDDDESDGDDETESSNTDAAPKADAKPTLYCSFCSKSQHEVRSLVASLRDVYICNECVELCADMKKGDGEPVCIAPGSDGQRILLLKKIDEQLIQSLDWAEVIENVGKDVVLNIITGLQRQLEQCSGAVEAAADRAEAKAKLH